MTPIKFGFRVYFRKKIWKIEEIQSFFKCRSLSGGGWSGNEIIFTSFENGVQNYTKSVFTFKVILNMICVYNLMKQFYIFLHILQSKFQLC